MAIDKAAAKQNIADRLAGFPRYHPVSTGLLTDWRIEPGDMLTVQNDGTDYPVPVFTLDMDWKGGTIIDVQSTGSKKRPDPAKLNKGGYGGGRQKETEELQMIRHQADIEKTDERITLWATEDEWSAIKGEYETIHKSQFELTALGLTSTVTGVDGGNFDKNKAYAIGDAVVRNGKVYVFTSAHVAGTDWNYAEVAEAVNLYGSVKTHSSRISQTENDIGLVVETKSGQRVIKRAAIVAAINEDNSSTVTIEADKVSISGNTTIGDTMSYSNSNLYVKGDIYAMTPGGNYHALAGNLVVPGNCGLYFNNGDLGNVIVNATNMSQMLGSVANVRIVETSTGSGVYRLEYKNIGDTSWTPDETTFSRATGQASISGSWDGGGTYTITSSPPATSGSKIYVRPTVRLTGSGAENFTAEIMSDDETPVAQSNHVYGYLDIDGSGSSSMVKVYNQRDEEVENPGHYAYSGVIAQISVGGVYTEGVTDGTVAGKNAVTINKGTWSNGTVAFSKSEGTADTKSVHLVNASPTWSGTTATVAVWDGAAAQTGSGFDTGHRVTLDASEFVTTRPTITSNGTYTPSSPYIGFSSVTVSVPTGSHSVESKKVGTYSTKTLMDEAAKADNGGVAPTVNHLGTTNGAYYLLIRTTCGSSKKYYSVH